MTIKEFWCCSVSHTEIRARWDSVFFGLFWFCSFMLTREPFYCSLSFKFISEFKLSLLPTGAIHNHTLLILSPKNISQHNKYYWLFFLGWHRYTLKSSYLLYPFTQPGLQNVRLPVASDSSCVCVHGQHTLKKSSTHKKIIRLQVFRNTIYCHNTAPIVAKSVAQYFRNYSVVYSCNGFRDLFCFYSPTLRCWNIVDVIKPSEACSSQILV